MEFLKDSDLIFTYELALKLKVDDEFIKLLIAEMNRRHIEYRV